MTDSTLLALDLGGTHAACSLVAGDQLLASRHIDLPDTSNFSAVAPLISRHLQGLASAAPSPVHGLGIGISALVDSRTNRVLSTNGKYEDSPQFDFDQWSRSQLDVPVRLENDARLALRGEMSAGAARSIGDVVLFTLGTGIGGVAAMDGRPLLGCHGQAGVLAGHVPVRERGRPCTCGGQGCAEAEASGWALPLIASDWPDFATSLLAQKEINFKSLFICCSEGDRVALEIRDHCLTIWGMMAVAAVHSFDPEIILFGGGAMAVAEQILPVIEKYVHQNTWTPWGKTRIAAATLGSQAAALGVPSLFAGSQIHV